MDLLKYSLQLLNSSNDDLKRLLTVVPSVKVTPPMIISQRISAVPMSPLNVTGNSTTS